MKAYIPQTTFAGGIHPLDGAGRGAALIAQQSALAAQEAAELHAARLGALAVLRADPNGIKCRTFEYVTKPAGCDRTDVEAALNMSSTSANRALRLLEEDGLLTSGFDNPAKGIRAFRGFKSYRVVVL